MEITRSSNENELEKMQKFDSLEKEKNKTENLPSSEELISSLEEKGLDKYAEVYKTVVDLSEEIKSAGGQALLVGGCVRDILAGKIPKDFDIEVRKLTSSKIEEISEKFGKCSDIGKSFGILKLSLGGGLDLDISLPRKDSKIADGHKGFEIKTDPFMSIEDGARRRDFTINSMASDPITGELFDPFGGAKDLKERVLRITDEERFGDDPLRVLRALQFVGRLGLSIEGKSAKIIMNMAPQLKELPKERIFEEWKKMLLKSEKPSLGLAAGMALGVFKEIHPVFPPLAETPQDSKWHPEGDVWIHTLMSVDEAAKIIRREGLDEDNSMVVMFSALCHDLGKPYVTEIVDGCIRSYGHEDAGDQPTKVFLASLGVQSILREKITQIVVNHLAPTLLYTDEIIKNQPISDGAIRKLAKRIYPATIRELVLVAEADQLGRGPFKNPEISEQLLFPNSFPQGEWLLKRARNLDVEKSKPVNLIEGRDLISLGFKNGKHIGDIIRLANILRDEKEFTKEMILQVVYGLSDDCDKAIFKLKSLVGD
ncbi:MAG: CCA tRNA nucleotidyltransferase [bacterium]